MIRRASSGAAFLLCLTSLCLTLAGCWNLREPEDMAHVLAVAFDLDEKRDLFKVYAQVANPPALAGEGVSESGGARSASGGKPFWTVSARGHTPLEAMRNLVPLSTKELFWSHASLLVISEKLARKGVLPIMDTFERDRQLRMIARPVVCEGDVGSLMEAEFPLEKAGAEGLLHGVTAVARQRSVFPTMFLSEAVATLSEPGIEMVIGRVEVLSGESKTTSSRSGVPKPPVKFSGAAVFRKDRMVGWLNEREARGWHWLMGRVSGSNLILTVPGAKGSPLTVEVSAASVKVEPLVKGDNVRMKVTLKTEGRIQEVAAPEDLAIEGETIESLKRRLAQVIRNDMEAAISKAQALRSDIFGFGWSIYRTRYNDWKKLEKRWEEIFTVIPVELNVKAEIRRSGLIAEPPSAR